MGPGGRAPEVGGPVGGLGPPSVLRRRTTLRVWCGVIFLGTVFLAPACNRDEADPGQRRLVLTIGVPESGATGPDIGTGSLITTSTLEGLTQVNASVDGRALPRLAESWAWENGGRRLRLTLREGVTFHDGTPLTATVASEALQAAISQPNNQSLYPSLLDIIDIRPDGLLSLVLELSEPSAFLPEELDLPLAIGPNNAGTGPFRLVRRDGSNAVLERFDGYYLGSPQIDEIVVRPFDTMRTAWTNLLRGEVDMVTNVPPDAIDFVSNGDIQVVPFARSYQFLIAFNSAKAPFTIPAVRRALNMAVDRVGLVKKVLQGQGQIATGPLWPQHWAYDRTAPSYGYDPEFASALLNSAGLPVQPGSNERPPARFRFTCLMPEGFSLLERMGLEIQKQLFDISVDVQFEVVTLAEYDTRIREGRFDALLVDLISGPTFGRPFIFWRSAKTFKGLNVFGYENSEVDRLFNVLRTSMSEAAVRSATGRLQRVLLEDPPALFIAWNARARAIRSHFNVAPESGLDPLWTIHQWTENLDNPTVSSQ